MSLQPALKDTRVTNAYNATLMTMRRAREQAIAERRVYLVTFNNAVSPNTSRLRARLLVWSHPPSLADRYYLQVRAGYSHHTGHHP